MMAVWLAVDEAAIARCNSSGGTMPGTSVCMVGVSNARAVPLTNKIASITSPWMRAFIARRPAVTNSRSDSSWNTLLLDLDVRRLDDLVPGLDLGLEERRGLGQRRGRHFGREGFQALLHGRIVQRLVDVG